ncbi:hypothetical protein DLJ57_18555, partial [Micromonospora chalcea]
MPDDEETTVRRRLARLFGPGPGEAEPGLGLRPGFPERDGGREPSSGANPWSAEPDADDGPSHDAPVAARGLASRLPGPG